MPKFQPPTVPGQVAIDKDGEPTFSFKRWLETVQQWLSNSGPPKTSASAGTPLQIQGLETDGVYLYVCTSKNKWQRIPLNNF